MPKMPHVPGLVRRGKTFSYRSRVPSDIAVAYGKREERISLKTRDYDKAAKRAREMAVEFDKKFDVFRGATTTPAAAAAPQSTRTLSSAERQRLCDDYYKRRLEDEPVRRHAMLQQARKDPLAFWRGEFVPIPADDHVFKGWPYSYWHDVLKADGETRVEEAILYAVHFNTKARVKALEQAHTIGDCDDFLPIADEIATLEAKDRVRLALAIMGEEIRALNDITAKDDTRLREIIGEPVKAIAPAPESDTEDSPVLSDAATGWITEKAKSRWTPRHKATCEATLALFIEVVGDKAISSYSKADVRGFKAILQDLPPNRSKLKVTRDLAARDAAKEARRLGMKKMSIRNVNKQLTIISGLFQWLVGNYDHIAANPFANATISFKSNVRDQRHSFSTDDLREIFSAPIYVGCRSASLWSQAGKVVSRGSAKFWLPLLGLYTGARLNELCKLRVVDVREQDGIHYFDINDEKHNDDAIDPRLKTNASSRQIPVHEDLVAFGFLGFHAKRGADGSERLFPELRVDKFGQLADGFGKHFARFLKSIGVKRPKIDFHSFRHTWVDACRSSRLTSDVIFSLKGEALKGTLARYGDGKTDLDILAEETAKLRFKGLDLSHLHAPGK